MSIFNNQISPRRLAKWQHKERMAMYNNPNFNQFSWGNIYPYFPQNGMGDNRLGTNFPYFPKQGEEQGMTYFPYFPSSPQKLDPKILSWLENNPSKSKIDMSQAKEVKGSIFDLLRKYNENRQIQGGAYRPTYSVGGGVGPVDFEKLNETLLNNSMASVTSRPTQIKKTSNSFENAFAQARAEGKSTFPYNGKIYTTKMKGEGKTTAQRRNNNAEMADIATARMNQFNQKNKTYQGYYQDPPIKIKDKKIDNNFIPSYNRNMGNQLAQTRGDQSNLNDFQRMENAYNSGKTFLDLQGKEKQLAPLAALDAALTYAARNIGLPIAKTVSGVGSTSDKVQSVMSLIPFASGVNSAVKPIAKQIAKQAIKKSTAYMGPRMLSPIAKNPNASKAKLAAWFTQANPQLAQAIKKYGVDYLINGL
jgi:hypothetical protein